jgi:hypothetical protein
MAKIMNHPDKDMIIGWMAEGKGVRKICKMLQERYPGDKEKQLSIPTIQRFRKQHMKLEGQVLEDIKKASKRKELKREHVEVQNLPTYKQKISEIADVHIDIKRGLVGMEKLITARLENLFDAAQRGEITTEREKVLQGYFDRYLTMIDKWAKYVDKVADVRIEANINVTVVQEQMAVLRQTVYELVREMDPELSIGFLDRLNGRIGSLTYKPMTPPTTESLIALRSEVESMPDAEILEAAASEDNDVH